MDAVAELNFFVLLVNKKSLAATARSLNITPPAVTKRLVKLEQRLGVRLLNRTTRKIALTYEGELYYEHAKRLCSEIDEVEALVSRRNTEPSGLLRVNAPLGFGRSYIAGVMSEFSAKYPKVNLQLKLTDRPINLAEDAFDLQIRFGEIPDSRLLAKHIATNRRLLCASPKYLQKHGVPLSTADLSQHNCIVLKQNEAEFGIWRLRKDNKTESIKVNARLVTNDGSVALKWALDGHGVVMRAEWDIANYIRSGELVLVLTDYETTMADIYAVYLEKLSNSPKLAAFVAYLESAFLSNDLSDSADARIW